VRLRGLPPAQAGPGPGRRGEHANLPVRHGDDHGIQPLPRQCGQRRATRWGGQRPAAAGAGADGTGHRPCDGGVAARPGAPRRPGLPDRGAGRARRRRGGARGRPGGRAAGRPGGDRVTLSAALILPWATGVLLVALDGRRRAVGLLAVVMLLATLVLLAVLMAGVLADGSRDVVTGRWPEGVGIVLRADTLGVAFALLSVLVLLA